MVDINYKEFESMFAAFGGDLTKSAPVITSEFTANRGQIVPTEPLLDPMAAFAHNTLD